MVATIGHDEDVKDTETPGSRESTTVPESRGLAHTRSPIQVAFLLFLFLNCVYLLTSTGRVRSMDEIDSVLQADSRDRRAFWDQREARLALGPAFSLAEAPRTGLDPEVLLGLGFTELNIRCVIGHYACPLLLGRLLATEHLVGVSRHSGVASRHLEPTAVQ